MLSFESPVPTPLIVKPANHTERRTSAQGLPEGRSQVPHREPGPSMTRLPGSRAHPGHWPLLHQVAPGERSKGAALTLVEDVHARLVGTDDLQDFGVRGEDTDYVPVIRHQLLRRLLLRDAFWHYQSVLDFKFGGPIKGGVINFCRDRETRLESPTHGPPIWPGASGPWGPSLTARGIDPPGRCGPRPGSGPALTALLTTPRWWRCSGQPCQDADGHPPEAPAASAQRSHHGQVGLSVVIPCTDENTESQPCWASRPTPHSWRVAEPAPKPVSACRRSRRAEGRCSARGEWGSC